MAQLFLRDYNFKVLIEGSKMAFARVSGLEQSTESEETFMEGGVNNRVYSRYNRVASQKTATFERGIRMKLKDKVTFTPGQYLTQEIIIHVQDHTGKLSRKFYLDGAVIRKISYSDLDARQSEIFIERLEVGYDNLTTE